MALEGTIRDFSLADILQLIGIQRKSGVLTLDNESDVVTVNFLDGQVVGADTKSRNLEDLLGSVLVRTGRITEPQLQEALKIQNNTLQRLGFVLVKCGFISEEELREALRIQVTQIIYRLFRWRDGRYHFAPLDQVEYDRDHFIPVGAETILMEGARMIDEWPIIERRIKSPRAVFTKTAAGRRLDVPVASIVDTDIDFDLGAIDGSGRSGKDEIVLSPEERDVLRMIDGAATMQDLVDHSPMGEFDVYRVVVELLNRNLVQEVKVAESSDAPVESTARTRAGDWAGHAVVLAGALFALATLPLQPGSPWRLVQSGAETALLKTYASRSRIERIEQAIQVFYLDTGTMPAALGALSQGRYLREDDLLDPWGRPYRYALDETGYVLEGVDGSGQAREDLAVRRGFRASQRLVLQGGAGR